MEQAVKKIYKLTGDEITVEDLIHYWGVGKLEIKTNISITPDELFIGGVQIPAVDIRFMVLDINRDIANAASSNNLKIFKEESDTGLFSEFFNLISKEEDKDSIAKLIHERIYATGEFYITNLLYSTYEYCSESEASMGSFLSMYFIEENYQVLAGGIKEKNDVLKIDMQVWLHKDKDPLTLPITSLFIRNDDLEAFLKGEVNIDIEEKKVKFESFPVSNTVKENRMNFIKTLLYMDYGITNAAEAKKAIRNGKLGQKLERLKNENAEEFNRLNLNSPSEQTLYNWYSQS